MSKSCLAVSERICKRELACSSGLPWSLEGLNYFHAHRFRSRAVIEFGSPIDIRPEWVEEFRSGGTAKRAACGKLLDTIYGELKSVTINAGSYETLMVWKVCCSYGRCSPSMMLYVQLVQAARRLYHQNYKLHISQVVDLNRRFLIGYNLFKNEPKVVDLQQRVLAYNQLLKYHGIRDHQVAKTDLGGKHTLQLLLRRLCLIVVLSLLAFPG